MSALSEDNMKRLWDSRRGRLAEFGFDIRGGWLHVQAGRLSRWLAAFPKPEPGDGPSHPRKRRQRVIARLDCFCEACIREFLPWPFSW